MTDTTESTPSTDDRIEAPPPPARGYVTETEQKVTQRGITPDASSDPPSNPALRLAGLVAVLVAVGLWRPWMLVMILGLVVMIFLHELGHFIMAKRAGMKVTEFFLCFGPKLWSFKRGETEYGVKLLPLGAYVKIIGMSNMEEVPPSDEGRTYRQKTFGQRVGVAVAGSTMHFLLALVLIFISLVMVGQPGGTLDPRLQGERWAVGNVIAGSGAAAAGLQAGDKIVSIDGRPTGEWNDVRSVVQGRRGETVAVVYDRDGRQQTTEAELRPFGSGDRQGCCLGIEVAYPKEKLSPTEGLTHAPLEFGRITSASIGALGNFFSLSGLTNFADQVGDAGKADDGAGSTTDQSSGSSSSSSSGSSASSSSGSEDNRLVSIVGVVKIGSDVGAVSPAALIALFALVNISLGMINLFPLLPLDGGHVAIAVYEKAQEKRLRRRRYFADVSRLLPITYAFILVLGVLAVSTLYLDIAAPLSVK